MANDKPTAWADPESDYATFRGDGNITVAFIRDIDEVPLGRDTDGAVVPAVTAQFYVIVQRGRPLQVLSREEMIKAIGAALVSNDVTCRLPRSS